MQSKHLTAPLEIKSIEDNGNFAGYGSIFGNSDSYGDIVVKGAFANSLNKKSPKQIKMLWQHNQKEPIGVYEVIKEDDRGLFVEGKLAVNDVQRAREAYALLKMGALDGLSIGFYVNEKDVRREKGANYLNNIDLWEISIVTFPANTAANIVGVKSIREFEHFLRDVGGFSKQRAKEIASCGFKNSNQCDADMELIKSMQKFNQSIKEFTNECRS